MSELDNWQGTCEVLVRPKQVKGAKKAPTLRRCEGPAVLRYATMGGGHMRMCRTHGEKHRASCEKWSGTAWTPTGRNDV